MSDREIEEQGKTLESGGKQVAKVSAAGIVQSAVGTPATQATTVGGMQQQLDATVPRMQDLGVFLLRRETLPTSNQV